MIAFNVLTVEEAYAAINYDTIILLFGMMIVVANLRLSGFFTRGERRGWWSTRTGPSLLLAAIVLVSGVFSAFFVNDTMCLVLTPLVLEITARAAAQSRALPAGGGDGVEHRQRGHDHGQPAEHDDRQLLAASTTATFAAALAPVAAGRARVDRAW